MRLFPSSCPLGIGPDIGDEQFDDLPLGGEVIFLLDPLHFPTQPREQGPRLQHLGFVRGRQVLLRAQGRQPAQ
jgi:hypothetical protein